MKLLLSDVKQAKRTDVVFLPQQLAQSKSERSFTRTNGPVQFHSGQWISAYARQAHPPIPMVNPRSSKLRDP